MPVKQFMDKFGHLRPGTYDICSQRYADRKDILQAATGFSPSEKVDKFIYKKKKTVSQKIVPFAELQIKSLKHES